MFLVGLHHLFRPPLAPGAENGPLGQQAVQHIGELSHVAAPVVPHVEDQSPGPLVQKGVHLLPEAFGAVGVKILYLNIAHAAVQQLAGDRVGLHRPTQERDLPHCTVGSQEGKSHRGARLPHDGLRAVVAGLSGHGGAVHRGDDLSRLHAGLSRRGAFFYREDGHAPLVFESHGDTHADIGVGTALVLGLVGLRRQIVAPPVAQAVHHPRQGAVRHGLGVIVPHELGADHRQPLQQGHRLGAQDHPGRQQGQGQGGHRPAQGGEQQLKGRKMSLPHLGHPFSAKRAESHSPPA